MLAVCSTWNKVLYLPQVLGVDLAQDAAGRQTLEDRPDK